MSNKKWLYKKDAVYSNYVKKYIEYWNLPFLRNPSNHRLMRRLSCDLKEIIKEGHSVKRVTAQDLKNYDNYEDIHVSANKERKSWKRNSKRRHQWKNK